MIVHDYGNPHWHRIKRAVDEFRRGIPEKPVIVGNKLGASERSPKTTRYGTVSVTLWSFIVRLIIAAAVGMKGTAGALIIAFPSRYLKSLYRQRGSIALCLTTNGGDYLLGLNLAHADTVEIAIVA